MQIIQFYNGRNQPLSKPLFCLSNEDFLTTGDNITLLPLGTTIRLLDISENTQNHIIHFQSSEGDYWLLNKEVSCYLNQLLRKSLTYKKNL